MGRGNVFFFRFYGLIPGIWWDALDLRSSMCVRVVV